MEDPIQLKGIRQGILVTLSTEGEWAKLIADLAARIDSQSAFFRGGNIVLDVGKRAVRGHELANLNNLLQKREVNLVCVLSTSATTQGATHKLGLSIELPEVSISGSNNTPLPGELSAVQQPVAAEAPVLNSEVTGTAGVLIRRTLRSGKTLRSDGHVIVIGDVNPGAEIIAAGDIIVWGRLLGVVHAGAMGDETCAVCALDLQPTQLRIGAFISVSPPTSRRRRPKPERAFVENGQIKAEVWSG